jgi:hypothetical protein
MADFENKVTMEFGFKEMVVLVSSVYQDTQKLRRKIKRENDGQFIPNLELSTALLDRLQKSFDEAYGGKEEKK